MYIRRKLYSNIEGERVPVEQTVLFSAKDDAKGAAIGAGVAAGAAGLGAAGLYGAQKLTDRAYRKAAEKVNALASGEATGDMSKATTRRDAIGKVKGRLDKAIGSATGWLNAKDLEGKILRDSKGRLLDVPETIKRTARNRKIGAGLAAAGLLAAGAGAGAGIAHLKGKKKAEEKVYSVLMTEDELALFSEVAKDAGIGAGVGAGAAITAGGAALATKGAGVLERKLAKGRVLKAVDEKNKIMKEAGEKAKSEAKKWAGKKGVQRDMVMNAINSGKAKASNVKISDAGKIEKGLAAISKGGATATKWVKNNPKLAAGIAAGTIATGAAAGAGIGAVRDRNKD